MKRFFLIVIFSIINIPLFGQNYRTDTIYENSYEDSIYKDTLVFYSTVFINGEFISFMDSYFHNPVSFNNVDFKDDLYFSSTKFYSDAKFQDINFNKNAYFNVSSFEKNIEFLFCKFDKSAQFANVSFKDNIYIAYSHFSQGILFMYSEFQKELIFQDLKINGEIKFNNSKFHEKLYFLRTEFLNEVYFNNATLPTYLILEDIKINEFLDFSLSKLRSNQKCKISLFNVDLSKIRINYDLFELYFNPKDSLSMDQKKSIYLQLKEKFKEDGLKDSEKAVDLEYQKFYLWDESGWNVLKKGSYIIQKGWWNFGYDKGYIFLWILGSFSIFAIINFCFYQTIFFDNYKPELKILQFFGSHSFKKRILNSIVLTGLIFFGLKLEFNHFQKVNGWFFYIIFIYGFGIICLGYLFNFIIQS